MNRRVIALIVLLSCFACSRNIPTTSTKSDTTNAPSAKVSTAPVKKETRPLPLKRPAANKASPPARVLTTYQSTGNDVADITVKLQSNKKFNFQMTIKPKEGEKKDDQIILGGTWKSEKGKTVLFFERKDVDLNALFDKTYSAEGEFEILDAHRVALNTQLGVIHIWGVACEKK